MAESPANVHSTSALPDDVREGLVVANMKAVAEQGAVLSNMALANAVAHQQAMWQISQASVGKIVESIIETRPSEGGVDVATLQQLLKGAALTPPVTA